MRHSWVFGLLAAAVAVAAACEDPGASGTFAGRPKKTASPKTTPPKDPCASQGGNSIVGGIEGRSGLVFEKIDFKADAAEREITLLNLTDECKPAIDTSRYVLAYEFPVTIEGEASTSIRFLRIAGNKQVAGEARLAVKDNTTDLVKDASLDDTSTTLGLQPSAGALALFRDATASENLTSQFLTDYVQWGAPATVSYRFAAIARTTTYWDDITKFASGSSETGKILTIKASGSAGSTNWELK